MECELNEAVITTDIKPPDLDLVTSRVLYPAFVAQSKMRSDRLK